MKFFYKSSCSTCREALKVLKEKNLTVELRDMTKDPLSKKEIKDLVGDRDIKPFLNTRNQLFRERGYKDHPPTKNVAIIEMSKEANLIKRPIMVHEGTYTFGFDRTYYFNL